MRLLGNGLCLFVLATGCLFAFAACGGGSTAVPPSAHGPLPNTTPTAGPAGFAPVSFTIALPKAPAGNGRKPLFVPPPTTSISVSVNGTTPQVFPCTPSTCSGSFTAPAGGSVNFLFTAVDASSHALANDSLTQTIAANGTNALAVTLEGIIDHASVSVIPAGLSSAVSGQATVSATAFDADGDVITGTYAAPLIVSTGDTTGTVTVTGGTLANDTATGAMAYAYSPATAYSENHFFVGASSTTETAAQHATPFVIGRTFYTFTPTAVVGFAPGATAPTRTIAIPGGLLDVSALGCDGSNVDVVDIGAEVVYGVAPGATTPTITYTSDLDAPIWVAGPQTPVNRAQFYLANAGGSAAAIDGYQGPISTPPFTIPPDAPVQEATPGSSGALQVDGNGNVDSAIGGVFTSNGGYDVFDALLNHVIATGQNFNTFAGSNQIAVDNSTLPIPRIYAQDLSINATGEISEYDNYATTPTFISMDNDYAGLFVDPAGRIYTLIGVGLPASRARKPGSRRRALQEAPSGVFDVYAPGNLAGTAAYAIPGQSLTFDSAGYVYAVSASGSVTEYAPGGTTVFATFPGTSYGMPTAGPDQFGTFCQ
jgi:hypothetical protein